VNLDGNDTGKCNGHAAIGMSRVGGQRIDAKGRKQRWPHTARVSWTQALPVGPGELSGMCRVTDISIDGTHPGPTCLVKKAHI
jgi:hypothetical protein